MTLNKELITHLKTTVIKVYHFHSFQTVLQLLQQINGRLVHKCFPHNFMIILATHTNKRIEIIRTCTSKASFTNL
jgi:hypothetical protein